MSAQDKQKRLPNHAILDEWGVEEYGRLTEQGVYDLLPAELFWKDRQPYLHDRGYSLRPRYLPNWRPSWKGTRLDPTYCEDSIVLITPQLIDARRIRDNKLVAIKKIRKDSQESNIAIRLASIKDPQNHCVPICEILPDPYQPGMSLLVMPYLRSCDDPEFVTVGDIVEFINQTLEGLVFLHRNRVAHRDIAMENVMMDGSLLYPDGHHPVRTNYTPDALFEIKPPLRGSKKIKYYYIDFGLSSVFPEGTSPYVVGRVGRDKEVPELSSTVPYDAFKVDIFTLGNMYYQSFEQKYNSMHFLVPLLERMRQQRPEARPSAAELLAQWEGIRADLPDSLLRWRLGPKSEPAFERLVHDTVAVAWEGMYRLRKFVGQ
ncbi:kinase-like domain-containing protein [Trametes polyzona]|nr:kinase-like domain-containing protein [Trametes polyzona]